MLDTKEFKELHENLKLAVKNKNAKKKVKLLYDFVKEHKLLLVELNTAWVEKSEVRRTVWNPKTCMTSSFKNITDKEFVDKFNKGKNNVLFAQSNFWGLQGITII